MGNESTPQSLSFPSEEEQPFTEDPSFGESMARAMDQEEIQSWSPEVREALNNTVEKIDKLIQPSMEGDLNRVIEEDIYQPWNRTLRGPYTTDEQDSFFKVNQQGFDPQTMVMRGKYIKNDFANLYGKREAGSITGQETRRLNDLTRFATSATVDENGKKGVQRHSALTVGLREALSKKLRQIVSSGVRDSISEQQKAISGANIGAISRDDIQRFVLWRNGNTEQRHRLIDNESRVVKDIAQQNSMEQRQYTFAANILNRESHNERLALESNEFIKSKAERIKNLLQPTSNGSLDALIAHQVYRQQAVSKKEGDYQLSSHGFDPKTLAEYGKSMQATATELQTKAIDGFLTNKQKGQLDRLGHFTYAIPTDVEGKKIASPTPPEAVRVGLREVLSRRMAQMLLVSIDAEGFRESDDFADVRHEVSLDNIKRFVSLCNSQDIGKVWDKEKYYLWGLRKDRKLVDQLKLAARLLHGVAKAEQ